MASSGDPSALKRTSAGSYRTIDGRFTVEQASGRWLVLDTEEQDELGLPLTRGPYATLDAVRLAIGEAREGPAPRSQLGERAATIRRTPGDRPGRGSGSSKAAAARRGPAPDAAGSRRQATTKGPPATEIRTYRAGEGRALRSFWATIGFHSLGDDDDALDRLAARNPGLVIVAQAGDTVVGTALGAWDGRRGWLYHVAVSPELRRTGLGRRLVHEVERRLRALGCPKVNLIVRDDNPGAKRFWEALGYTSPPARQYGKEL